MVVQSIGVDDFTTHFVVNASTRFIRESSFVVDDGYVADSAAIFVVDFTARFQGKIQIGNGYVQKIVAKADPWKLLALALSKLNGVTIKSLIREAEVTAIDTESLKEQATNALAQIKKPTTTVCQGKTTGDVNINVQSADIKVVN